MCEFTGLDFEMEIHEHYFEVMDVVGRLFTSIFQGLHDSLSEPYLVCTVEFLTLSSAGRAL